MSIEQTLQERGARYGDFSDHARICQAIKSDMTDADGWERLSDVQKQALEVIADKIARILSGDPNYADNWHDIQGYAKLAEERLPKEPADLFEDEPATQMEDDSQRMAAIGQNGNTGEHYDKKSPLKVGDYAVFTNHMARSFYGDFVQIKDQISEGVWGVIAEDGTAYLAKSSELVKAEKVQP